jgi:restriction endonuclease S subunit
MRVRLGQIAEVRTGYAFRGAVDKTKKGDRLLVQMSDFNPLRDGCFESVGRTDLAIRSDELLLQEGDILIKARGSDSFPLMVPKELDGALFTHPLVRLRTSRNGLLPEFLFWLLNKSNVQKQICQYSAGTVAKMLNLKHLKSLEIEVPPLSCQQKVKELLELLKEEEGLQRQYVAKKKQYVSGLIENLINVGEKNER